MSESKKLKENSATRPANASVGDVLRSTRLAKGLEIEEVSSSIHIRPAQLRAIEESNIEALPGMTYAVGFVRSYANYLGLNGAEMIHKFKAEHGHSATPSKLTFPEPIAESRMPDPIMIGAGAFFAVVVLVIWTIYSNMHGASKVVEEIPPAPAVSTTADVPVEDALPVPAETSSDAATAAAPLPSVLPPVAVTTGKMVPEQPVKTEVVPAEDEDSVAPEDVVPKKPSPVAAVAENAVEETPAVINIKRGKGRIVLTANQASWVQITDVHQNVIYKKVLRSGEQYYVPDQPGLSLVTTNAGGLDVSVDGQPVQSLGKPGDIVRGVILDPRELKIRKTRTRD
jgi:cytoskeleton protein RodZ